MPKLKKEKAAKTAIQRDVLYQEITSNVCHGDSSITSEDAKELLGWEDAAEGSSHVKEIFSLVGVRARCNNNVTNRPIYPGVVQTLKQEILRRRWLLNGEPIIVGRTGLLLNGQHTLLALVLACLEWEADKDRWIEYWPTAPTISKVLVSGIDEGDATVNTMDTCKPRSLADVIYRSDYFATLPSGERRVAARMTDSAIKLMWHRTGAGLDAFAPRRTHAESLDFIARHPKMLDAVKHVHEEDEDGHVSRYLSPGYAAGLLYLMGCSSTDPEAYRKASHPDESLLDWDRWNDACDFVVLLAAGGKETASIRTIMARSIEDGGLGNAERWAIIVSAWLAHSNGEAITEESLQLNYVTDEDGGRQLIEHPSVGGIDLGNPSAAEAEDVAPPRAKPKTPTEKGRQQVKVGNLLDEEEIDGDDPDPENIASASEEVKAKTLKRMRGEDASPAKPKLPKSSQPRKAGPNWAKGDVAWVIDPDGEHYLGMLTEDPWDCDGSDSRASVLDVKGDEWEVLYSDLSLENPTTKPMPTTPKVSKTQPKRKDKSTAEYKVGDRAWVWDKAGDHWRGKIIEMSRNGAKLKTDQGFQGCGTVRMVWTKDLRREQPNGHETA